MPKVFNLLSPRTPWRLFCGLGHRLKYRYTADWDRKERRGSDSSTFQERPIAKASVF